MFVFRHLFVVAGLVFLSGCVNAWTNPFQNNTGVCAITHCGLTLGRCMLDYKCAQAAICNGKCMSETDKDGCNLLCELNYGFNNTYYSDLLLCFIQNECLPVSPMNGICLAQDNQTDTKLTSLSQASGKWWILLGQNCGQDSTWRAGFDYYPCQRDEFVQLDNGSWIDNIAYCGGKANNCTTPILHTSARAEMTSPGVMTHWYLDAPLLPQVEEWRVLSYYQDWMLYVYCGSTPAGPYAGASVVSRTSRTISAIPLDIKENFVSTAAKFGFNYYTMCESDVTNCSD